MSEEMIVIFVGVDLLCGRGEDMSGSVAQYIAEGDHAFGWALSPSEANQFFNPYAWDFEWLEN